jgi:gliding motility-associated-like protein
MKRTVHCLLALIFALLHTNSHAQVFWSEGFGVGCNAGAFASGAAPTASNGAWNVTALAGNGSDANEWFISATEAGMGLGNCGDGCLNNATFTNRTLHLGANLPAFAIIDPGAAYGTGLAQLATNKRAESPVINCTGRTNITLAFSYLANGVPGTDFAEAMYFDGATWNSLGVLAPSMGACAPQGLWANQSYNLPASANNNANVRIGFRWINPGTGAGADPSVAIDDVTVSQIAASVTFTLPASACPGQTVQASVTSTVAGATSYSWSSTPGGAVFAPATSSVPAVSFPGPGTYTVTLNALNSTSNSIASSTQTINVTSSLVFTLTPSSQTICAGQSTSITATGGSSYTWSPASSLNTNVGPNVVATPAAQTTYTVIGTNNLGCSGSGVVTIFIGPSPQLAVAVTASAVCPGYSSTLIATGANSYVWTGSTMTPISQPSIAVGPGTYTVVGSVGASCNSQSVITITNAPPLNINISQSSNTTCIANNNPKFSKPVTLTASGASTYNWFPCDQYISICIGPVVNVRPPTSTCYTVNGNTSVCSGTAAICVTVTPQFTVGVTPPLPVMCQDDSLRLCVTQVGTLGIAPYNYVWTEPANTPPPSIDNAYASCVRAFPSNTISSGITYTTEVYDARGCVSMPRLVTVTVIPRPLTAVSIPTINGVPTNTLCFVENTTGVPDVTLNLTAENQNGLPPQFDPTFTWTPSYTTAAGPILTPNPTNGPTSTITISAPKRMPDIVTFTVISGYNGIPGCRREDTISVRVIDCRFVDTIAFSSSPRDTICTRQCITYMAETDTLFGGPQAYEWNFQGGNPLSSTLKNPTVCYNIPGKWNVTLKISNPYPKHTPVTGSTLTAGFFHYVKVVDIPNPRILPDIVFQNSPKDTIIRFNSSAVLTATNALSYTWRPDYRISALTGSVVTVNPHQTTQYIVTGYNSMQCYSNDTINVLVVEDCGEMFVPNAFSPNDDGANDILYVRGQCLETLTFMVFNRWGEKVFETNNQSQGWDGRYKGDMMNSGVFVYRVEGKTYDGKAYTMKGNVTLVR